MGYRNVDDQMDGHPKVRRLAALGKRRCGAAMALWVLAGCEARREVRRGRPAAVGLLYVLSAPVEAPQRAASDLADVGLWERCDHPDGEGWLFHDEDDWNRSHQSMSAEREGNRQRQAAKRARDAAAKSGLGEPVSRRDVTVGHAPPDQTRPDQARPSHGAGGSAPPRARVVSGSESTQAALVLASPSKPAKAQRKPKDPAPTTAVWEAYAFAFEQRYASSPVRNAKINGQLSQLVAQIGAEDAPHVARWYLANGDRWYVTRMHPVGQMVADCQKLRAEWLRGRPVTDGDARESAAMDEMRAQSERVAAMLAARKGQR